MTAERGGYDRANEPCYARRHARVASQAAQRAYCKVDNRRYARVRAWEAEA